MKNTNTKPTAATAAAATNATKANQVTANATKNAKVVNTPAENTTNPTAAPVISMATPIANTAIPITPAAILANATTPVANATTPVSATPNAVPKAPVENKNKYNAVTEKTHIIEELLGALTDNDFSTEAMKKLMNDIDVILNTKRKDLSFEGPMCNMEDASVLFGDKQSEKKFKDPEKETLCKRLHKDLTAISKKLAAGIALTPQESNQLIIIQIEFCKLMKFRGIYVGNAAWYITKTKADAGLVEIAHEDVFNRCSIIYSALDIFESNTNKILALIIMLVKFNTPESAKDVKYILQSLMITHNMSESQITSAVFGDTGVMDSATKNKIGKMCIRPGTFKFLDEVDLKPLTPIYRISDPMSNPNIASLVVPNHYYFTIGDTNTILDIDPTEETIKRIMVIESKKAA